MQSDNRLFDDFAKFVNGAAGTLAGMAREGEAAARERAKTFLGGMDFVSRDEFEVVKAMAVAARDEADALRARIDALEAAAKPAPVEPAAATPVASGPVAPTPTAPTIVDREPGAGEGAL